jgi:hypothetical protein
MDMKPNRFPEEQIIGILREQEAGAKTTDVVASTGSAVQLSTNGRPSTVASKYRTPSD